MHYATRNTFVDTLTVNQTDYENGLKKPFNTH